MQLIVQQEERFLTLDNANGHILDFKQECLFARQQISKNDYIAKVAAGDPASLQAAILNVAAIGISLNPASQHAYLIPRNGSICLDISFRGLVKLATDSGSIKWAKAELVYGKDTFIYKGPSTPPKHEADVFGERGDIKGVYCIAKLPDGEHLIEVMRIDEVHKVRDTSQAYKKGGGPWVDWYEEMVKKTIIKRAYKSWPQTPNKIRLDTAVKVLNEHEGTAYTIEQHTEYMSLLRDEDALGFYVFTKSLNEREQIALYNSSEKGHKMKDKDKCSKLLKEGHEKNEQIIMDLCACIDSEDNYGANEILESLNNKEKEHVMNQLNGEVLHKLNQLKEAA